MVDMSVRCGKGGIEIVCGGVKMILPWSRYRDVTICVGNSYISLPCEDACELLKEAARDTERVVKLVRLASRFSTKRAQRSWARSFLHTDDRDSLLARLETEVLKAESRRYWNERGEKVMYELAEKEFLPFSEGVFLKAKKPREAIMAIFNGRFLRPGFYYVWTMNYVARTLEKDCATRDDYAYAPMNREWLNDCLDLIKERAELLPEEMREKVKRLLLLALV